MAVVKTIAIDIGISGAEASKAKLDAIDAKAESLKKAFPEYKLKIDSAAATERLAVFRGQVKATADAVTRPMSTVVLTDKARAKLLEVGAEAEKLRAKFPEFTVRINDAEAKRKLAVFAAEAKVTTDLIDRRLGGAGGSGGSGSVLSKLAGLLGGGGGGGAASAGGGGLSSLGSAGPYAIGGLAALGALLAPGAVGLGIGGLAGGGLLAGGLFGASTGKTRIAADTTALSKAQAAAKASPTAANRNAVSAALATQRSDQSFFAPFTGLTQSFQGFTRDVLTPLRSLMGPLSGIIAQFGKGLAALGPQMTSMFKASLPFIQQFASVMLQAGKILMPAFTQAMNQMVKSGALPLMTQGLVVLVKGVAGFITALGPGMRSSAMIFRDVAVIIAATLRGTGLAVSWLANTFEDYFHRVRLNLHAGAAQFDNFRHRTAVVFDGVRHDIAHLWDMTWNNTVGRLNRGIADSQALTARFEHSTAHWFDVARHDIASIWDSAWNNTVGRTRRGVSDALGWIGSIPGRVTGIFRGAGSWLYGQGRGIVNGLWNGIKNVWHDVAGWFGGLPSKILHALHIQSPPPWAIDAGKHIMGGILKGLAHNAADVPAFFRGLASDMLGPLKGVWSTISGFFGGKAGAGVMQWSRLVSQALAMLGLPQSLASRVLYQMQTESGGNPNAVNLTDINARMGHPSQGLMQVIPGTFAAYHVPGTSWNIRDPLANIAAAINYGWGRYGPTLMSGGMGIGSGHGYALGTSSAAPGWAWAGEGGVPELIHFRGGEQVGPVLRTSPATGGGGTTTIIIQVDPAIASVTPDRRLGRQIAEHLGAHIKGGGRLYPAGTAPR